MDMIQQALPWVTAVLGAGYVIAFVHFWWREARRIKTESGYAPPHPRLWARLLSVGLVKILCRIIVGNVTLDGNEEAHKQRKKFHFVVVLNHQGYRDALVLGKLSKLYLWRFMVAMEQVRLPFVAVFYALAGAIPVIRRDSPAGKESTNALRDAAAAVLGAVKAIKHDSAAGPKEKGLLSTLALIVLCGLTTALHIVWLAIPLAVLSALGLIDLCVKQVNHFAIFFQGKFVENDELNEKDINGGAVKIARRFQKETGEPVAFLVGHITYLRNAQGKIVGARVRVSPPIPLDEKLPKKDDAVALMLLDEMVRLKAETAAANK
jgi:hypothetical protein